MAKVQKNPSISQGYNFNRDVHICVGHMTALKIGDQKFAADTEVGLPTAKPKDKKQTTKVVGVLSQFYWDGGHANNLQFRGQLQVANKQDMYLLVHTNMINTDVDFTFVIYDFDPVAKVYYPSVYSDEKKGLKGVLSSSGDQLDITVEDDDHPEVQSPLNYSFALGINPKEQAQTVLMAASNTKKFAKPWGVAVAAK